MKRPTGQSKAMNQRWPRIGLFTGWLLGDLLGPENNGKSQDPTQPGEVRYFRKTDLVKFFLQSTGAFQKKMPPPGSSMAKTHAGHYIFSLKSFSL
jgi:hypothetical protein